MTIIISIIIYYIMTYQAKILYGIVQHGTVLYVTYLRV